MKRLLFPPPALMAVFWAGIAAWDWFGGEDTFRRGAWFMFACCACAYNIGRIRQ